MSPPAQTGAVTIEMAGSWRVEQVEPVSDVIQVPPVTGTFEPNNHLRPPAVGEIIEMTSHMYVKGGGTLLDVSGTQDPHLKVYSNRADGRFAFYEVIWDSTDPRIADGGRSELRISAGSVDEDTMLAFVQFDSAVAFRPASSYVRGLFLVTLKR